MSYLPELIPIMIHMSVTEEVGTYDMVNGYISHKNILDKYKKIVDKKHTYSLIEENELSDILKAKRSTQYMLLLYIVLFIICGAMHALCMRSTISV